MIVMMIMGLVMALCVTSIGSNAVLILKLMKIMIIMT